MAPDGARPETEVSVIVVAAGDGVRLGAGVPKAFASLGNGTVLESAIGGVQRAGIRAQCVVVVPPERVQEAARIARKVYGSAYETLVTVVPGGVARAGSVAAGLRAVSPGAKVVLVHDAARALTPPEQFDLVAALVLEVGSGVVPVLPVVDTVKRLGPDGGIADTLDRRDLVLAQTPQGFPRDLIQSAYRALGPDAIAYTDDAAIVSAVGGRVVTAKGHERAFKITVPEDLRRADAILRAPGLLNGSDLRTGVGVDAHRFLAGVPLWLGGVEWPDEPAGLSGHSDGDVACHAIVDALLSAAGLGDIGSHFGVDDPAYAGASGATFISETVRRLAVERWIVGGVSVEIVANAPKIAPRRAELESVLAGLVGAPVSVAATTSDGLGITGDGLGIAAIATALLTRA